MSKSKMIDFDVTFGPSVATASHISHIINSLPVAKEFINQTTYGSIRNKPIALSIEDTITLALVVVLEHEWKLMFAVV